MDSKVQLEKLLGLFYDYVENAEKKYSIERLKEILLTDISVFAEYLIEHINQQDYKQGFHKNTPEMFYQVLKDAYPDETIYTDGYKKMCEHLYNMQKDAQQKRLQNILLRTMSIQIYFTDKDIKLYVRFFILRYEYIIYTFKKE